MNRLFMVRHGVTDWNDAGIYQGQSDVPLSDAGRRQIAALRERLREERFAVCYTSALQRARVSAEILLEGRPCPVRQTMDLNEMHYGAWEGLSRSQIKERFPEDWARFRADPLRHPPSGGETLRDVQLRVARMLTGIAGEFHDADILVVAHGGSLRAIVAHYLDLEPPDFWKLRLDNASISVVEVNARGGLLALFNDTAHLGPRKPPTEHEPAH